MDDDRVDTVPKIVDRALPAALTPTIPAGTRTQVADHSGRLRGRRHPTRPGVPRARTRCARRVVWRIHTVDGAAGEDRRGCGSGPAAGPPRGTGSSDDADRRPELQRLGLVVELPPNPEPDDSGKGLGDEIGTLVASGAGVAAARYLLSALQLWLSRPDRRTTIDLHEADRSVTLTGNPTEDQRRLVREFLDARRGDSR